MEIPELPPAAVNYRWLPAALTTVGSSALKSGSWQSINCNFARFVEKIKKIKTYSECYKTLHILYMYFYRGVCKVS